MRTKGIILIFFLIKSNMLFCQITDSARVQLINSEEQDFSQDLYLKDFKFYPATFPPSIAYGRNSTFEQIDLNGRGTIHKSDTISIILNIDDKGIIVHYHYVSCPDSIVSYLNTKLVPSLFRVKWTPAFYSHAGIGCIFDLFVSTKIKFDIILEEGKYNRFLYYNVLLDDSIIKIQ